MASAVGVHERLVASFPGLAESPYQLTSPPTDKYNCVAWAAGDEDYWWWPGRFWPQDAPSAVTKVAFVKAFVGRGYEECDGPALEEGFEKICFFTKLGRPTHACRQLPDGSWTSKLGQGVDISHQLDGLRGTKYGKPTIFMRRPTPV